MQQYNAVKAEYPDKIIFFRMGDFYEMFGDDAIKAAPILNITLTSRGGPDKLPLAGVPYHAAEKYLARLLKAGEKVVIVEQVEDPRTARGVVKREVVEILTPGSASLEELESPTQATYLAALAPGDNGRAGLAYLDLSTAEFRLIDDDTHRIADRLLTLSPREALIPEDTPEEKIRALLGEVSRNMTISSTDRFHFDPRAGAEQMRKFFNVTSLEGFGVADTDLSVGAAAAIVRYLQDNRRDNLGHITRLSSVKEDELMRLDQSSIRNLELVESFVGEDGPHLFGAINLTRTAPGARRLRRNLMAPFNSLKTILRRQSAVKEMVESAESAHRTRQTLTGLIDLERLIGRLGVRRMSPRQAQALAKGLGKGSEVADSLSGLSSPLFLDSLQHYPKNLKQTGEAVLARLVESPPLLSAGGGIFRGGASAELDELTESISSAKAYMAGLQKKERQATGIPSLKLGFNKIFGYYLEVTHLHKDKIPEHYLRKQTLVNAERYITEEMKTQEKRILEAEERIFRLEQRLFEDLLEELSIHICDMQLASDILAEIDVVTALALLAVERNYVRPELTDGGELEICEGRHPVIETILPRGSFVPNDLSLDNRGCSIMILTGPNMSGKSTYLRQIGHIVVLAQIGSFVPAASAKLGLIDRIFTRVGAVDKLAQGQSTFMVEMLETANMLNNGDDKSLILLDEVGRGTSTFDGLSLAWAIVEEIHDRLKARTVFATHYHELTRLAKDRRGVVNFQVAVKRWQERIIFLHKIIPGGCDDSYGIEVSRLAGMPEKVVARAREILHDLESGQFASPRMVPGGVEDAQTSLFGPSTYAKTENPPDPALLEIKKRLNEIVVESVTPLEALAELDQLQKLLKDD